MVESFSFLDLVSRENVGSAHLLAYFLLFSFVFLRTSFVLGTLQGSILASQLRCEVERK